MYYLFNYSINLKVYLVMMTMTMMMMMMMSINYHEAQIPGERLRPAQIFYPELCSLLETQRVFGKPAHKTWFLVANNVCTWLSQPKWHPTQLASPNK